MAQDYDKIFKENIEEIILPLAEKILGLKLENFEEIPDDLQRTIERKSDFLKKIIHADSTKNAIIQIEFQKEDEPKMAYRMLEYYSILLRKYELNVLQYVFFIGKDNPKMETQIIHNNIHFRFELFDLKNVDYKKFIDADKPEEVILAILSNFGNENSDQVIDEILNRLKKMSIDSIRREKCVIQLEVLSNLRNLQHKIIQKLNEMALTYDLEKDIRFNQGSEKSLEVIKLLIKGNFTFEKIAEIVDVSIDFVKKIAESFRK